MGDKLFRLRNLAFLDNVRLGLSSLRRLCLAGRLGLLAQNFHGEWIGHVDDCSIHFFLIGPQGEQVRRNSHHHIHQWQIDRRLEVVCYRLCRLDIAGREMRNEILQENFHLA